VPDPHAPVNQRFDITERPMKEFAHIVVFHFEEKIFVCLDGREVIGDAGTEKSRLEVIGRYVGFIELMVRAGGIPPCADIVFILVLLVPECRIADVQQFHVVEVAVHRWNFAQRGPVRNIFGKRSGLFAGCLDVQNVDEPSDRVQTGVVELDPEGGRPDCLRNREQSRRKDGCCCATRMVAQAKGLFYCATGAPMT